MRFLLNILWLVLSGFWMFLGYMLVGLLWCITILGIPFGIASFRIGLFALWPFGRTIVKKPGAGVASGIGNVLWLILSGIGSSIPFGPWNMGVLWVIVRGWGIPNAPATSGIALYGDPSAMFYKVDQWVKTP